QRGRGARKFEFKNHSSFLKTLFGAIKSEQFVKVISLKVNYPPPSWIQLWWGLLKKPRVYPTKYFEYYDFSVISPTNAQPVCSSEVNG
ncbi:MAG TPA: hypothetical protein DEA78_23930, partial [Cyanobacteria bacterium UBA11159]|nr:hypothetical protein [Cyanobacteria bacterium UBA11159]